MTRGSTEGFYHLADPLLSVYDYHSLFIIITFYFLAYDMVYPNVITS